MSKKTLPQKVFPKQHRIANLNLKIWKLKKEMKESKAAYDLLMKLKNIVSTKKSSRDKLKIKQKKSSD